MQLPNFVVFCSSQLTSQPVLMVWNHNDFFFLHHPQVLLGFGRLQALYRSRQLAQQYKATRAQIIRFQAMCRGYLVRQKVAEQKKAACVIQAYARGMLTRQSYQRIKVMLTDTLWTHCCYEIPIEILSPASVALT